MYLFVNYSGKGTIVMTRMDPQNLGRKGEKREKKIVMTVILISGIVWNNDVNLGCYFTYF